MNVLVDTSIWIDFFFGKNFPVVEDALHEGRIQTTPLILAELLTGVKSHSEEKKISEFIISLNMAEIPLEHWYAVATLRRNLSKKGFYTSLPDAHIMQSAIDTKSTIISQDKIFKITKHLTKIDIL